jgi:hypothetical protein
MDKTKPTKEKTESEGSPKYQKKIKMTQEEYLATVELKNTEKESIDRVFNILCELRKYTL